MVRVYFWVSAMIHLLSKWWLTATLLLHDAVSAVVAMVSPQVQPLLAANTSSVASDGGIILRQLQAFLVLFCLA